MCHYPFHDYRDYFKEEDQQIIKRDSKWLIDGSTPIEDIKHALEIDEMPDEENYETLAGFMMFAAQDSTCRYCATCGL